MRDALRQIPRVHPDTGVQRVGGRLLAATVDDHLHTFEDTQGVSEVGERIVELVDGQRRVADIVAVLCEEFDVDPALCESDTLQFLQLLVEKQILVLD